MIPGQNIEKLKQAMVARRKENRKVLDGAGGNNYILFLGEGCARAANIPSFQEIARKVFAAYDSDSRMAHEIPPKEDRSDSDKLLESFYKLLEKMSGVEISIMMQSFVADIPVPVFYQDLALLIKAGYFNRILTTNFDTLLEQSLNGAGLRMGFDYQVMSLGGESEGYDEPAIKQLSSRQPSNPVYIIKLRGDLARQDMNITPDDIEEALRSQGPFVKSEMLGDMIMVGYMLECEPINRWLSHTQRKELWWVNSAPPDAPEIDIRSWAGDVIFMDEEISSPDTFFGQLSLRLLRRPAYASLKKSFKSYIEKSAGPDESGDVAETSPESDEEEVIEDLKAKIRSTQSLLNSLEHSMPPGERSPTIQAQIDYQKRQIAQLEDELRSMSTCRSQLLGLLKQVNDVLHSAHDKAELRFKVPETTLLFVQKMLDTVLEQYQTDRPDQHVVSSAIGAVITVAERLSVEFSAEAGKPDSDPAGVLGELARAIASFAPSIPVRGVK